MSKKIKLEPIEEQKEEPKIDTEKTINITLPESEAQFVMRQISDLCAIYQSIPSLPDTSKIEKNTNFYIEELFRILLDHGLITL